MHEESPDVEAIVLTGGSSRRMGVDKASLQVYGERSVDRIVRLLAEGGLPVTVLGPEGKRDANPGAGPLAALAAFKTRSEWVFVASCDIPLFDGRVVEFLKKRAGPSEAALPLITGRLQPLCSIYRASSLKKASILHANGHAQIMNWIGALDFVSVSEPSFIEAGLNPDWVRGANTPEEWSRLVNGVDGP